MRTPSPVFLALAFVACSGDTDLTIRTLTPEISVTPPTLANWTPQGSSLGPVEGSTPNDVIVGEVGTAELYVSNAGRATLDVTLELEGSAFALDLAEASVSPDSVQTFVVTFTPDNFLDYNGKITIRSNDEEQPEITVPLTGVGIDAPKPDIDITPQTIDFGEVAFGEFGIDTSAQLFNLGDAPLTVGSMVIEGSPAFRIETPFTPGAELLPGANFPLVLVYEPVIEGVGDDGFLVIPSNDPDEPETRVTLIGNGGDGFEYPEAIIACPETVEIVGPQFIRLDGSASTDPAELYPLEYTWQAIRVPLGSATVVNAVRTELEQIDVPLDVAGEYEVLLTVHNSVDTPSPATSCVMNVIPADDIRVELSWDGPAADLDLHVLESTDAALWDVPEDACWCNESPSWGANGADDDPRLDIDDRGGYGPENINISAPADGSYPVNVHYFARQGDQIVTATVVIWAEGSKVWEGSKAMALNDVWEVGTVEWPDASFLESNADLGTSTRNTCRQD